MLYITIYGGGIKRYYDKMLVQGEWGSLLRAILQSKIIFYIKILCKDKRMSNPLRYQLFLRVAYK